MNDVTEREFMVALERTSTSMRNWTVTRNFKRACQYKGPQSFGHASNAQRMHFDVDDTVSGKSGTTDVDFPFQVLLCEACNNYRRVDDSTYKTFENRGFLYDEVREQILHMVHEYPSMLHDLQSRISETSPPISLDVYNALFKCTDTDASSPSSYVLPYDHTLRCMMLFEETSTYMGIELDHAFLNAYTEAWNQQQGPAFKCDMLINCSCVQTCDWKLAFETPHEFSDLVPKSNEELLLQSHDQESQSLHTAGFFDFIVSDTYCYGSHTRLQHCWV